MPTIGKGVALARVTPTALAGRAPGDDTRARAGKREAILLFPPARSEAPVTREPSDRRILVAFLSGLLFLREGVGSSVERSVVH